MHVQFRKEQSWSKEEHILEEDEEEEGEGCRQNKSTMFRNVGSQPNLVL